MAVVFGIYCLLTVLKLACESVQKVKSSGTNKFPVERASISNEVKDVAEFCFTEAFYGRSCSLIQFQVKRF